MEKQVIKNITEFSEWMSSITGTFSLDTETTSLNWYTLRPIGISLCDGERACYFPLKSSDIKYCGKILKEHIYDHVVIMHNSCFDMKVLSKFGVDYFKLKIFDTMVGAFLLNENNFVALKKLARRILKIPSKEIKTYTEATSYGEHSECFYNYAMNDAIWTYDLYKIEKKQLKKQKLEYIFYDVEMPFQKVIAEMEMNGFAVEKEKAEVMADFVKEFLVEKKIALCESIGLDYTIQYLMDGGCEVLSMNFNSSPQLVKIIEGKLKLTITERTDTGLKSVGANTLNRLSSEHEFIRLLNDYKSLEKLYSSFLMPFSKFVDSDGRVRCSLNACGAITGRVSCKAPNLEQLPNPLKTKLLVNFRSLFVAPEGKDLIVADYSGQELRGLTDVSGDAGLIEAFNKNKDIHLSVTNKCLELNIPEEDLYVSSKNYEATKKKYSQERDRLKNGVVFPLIYGMTSFGMSKDMNVSEEQAQKWIDGFLDLYPAVRTEIEKCNSFLRAHRFVRNRNGRKRRLDPEISKSFRQAFNFLIQGLAADQIKLAASKCQLLSRDNPKWELKLILPVHDELVFEVSNKFSKEALKGIKYCMENCMELVVPSIVDIKIAKNYGEVK